MRSGRQQGRVCLSEEHIMISLGIVRNANLVIGQWEGSRDMPGGFRGESREENTWNPKLGLGRVLEE